MQYEYKTVPAPKVLSVKNDKEAEAAVVKFSDLINREAQGGWEFHSMETISTQEAPGCFKAKARLDMIHYNMLIFKREVRPAAPAEKP